jgi:hypothetical protein
LRKSRNFGPCNVTSPSWRPGCWPPRCARPCGRTRKRRPRNATPGYRLPHGYVGIDFSGANRNATAFTYQHLFAITRRSAFTARVGVFGFGNTDGNLFGEGNAQLDLLAGVGVLSSTDNPHNLEIEGTFNRYLRWDDDGVNRFQNRFTATAGYRL